MILISHLTSISNLNTQISHLIPFAYCLISNLISQYSNLVLFYCFTPTTINQKLIWASKCPLRSNLSTRFPFQSFSLPEKVKEKGFPVQSGAVSQRISSNNLLSMHEQKFSPPFHLPLTPKKTL